MEQNRRRTALFIGIALAAAAGIAALVIFVVIPAVNTGRAGALQKKGDLSGAYDAYDQMGEAGDAQARKRELQNEAIASRSALSMDFGGYEWLILEERGGKALLLMRDALETRPYHAAMDDITWEGCALRQWLNDSFYNSLPEADRARVAETAVINSGNTKYGTQAGKDTRDRVFLLSLAEAGLYFPDDASRVARSGGSAKFWWLRSPGMEPALAAVVTADGVVGFAGSAVQTDTRGVRPAMWVLTE